MSKPKILQDIDDIKNRDLKVKVGSFVRSTTAPSGLQTISGINFKPYAIIVLSVVATQVGQMSISFGDGVNVKGMYDINNLTVGAFSITGYLVHIRQGSVGTTAYTGALASFNDDGFTINWTKGSTVTDGSDITVNYMLLGYS